MCKGSASHSKCEHSSFRWLRASGPHWLQLVLAPCGAWHMAERPNTRNPNTDSPDSDAAVHCQDAFIWNQLFLSGPRADLKWSCFHYFKSEKHKEEGATASCYPNLVCSSWRDVICTLLPPGGTMECSHDLPLRVNYYVSSPRALSPPHLSDPKAWTAQS